MAMTTAARSPALSRASLPGGVVGDHDAVDHGARSCTRDRSALVRSRGPSHPAGSILRSGEAPRLGSAWTNQEVPRKSLTLFIP